MRYLNKIIFINSAHIPYAEIKLDGNVHFIGTQGVGKSTLLRSILFFYNVDKSKLGIRTQDKQKSYDEFYFPYPNSYIIYEICRENGNFFVMTFASNGRVAFRIVDCPYDKRFFIDNDNNVRYEWGRISEQIGTKVFKSNIIRGYEDFRNIIYGNKQEVDKDLRLFNLMESSKYQNVPRTIQNIFLNQSLESRVIKDTIIDSMDFASDSIDLNFYREHVKDFRQQYEDIWKWYKKEKNGKVKVRTDADNVIHRYSLYLEIGREISDLCANLNYAYERDTQRIPQINDAIVIKDQEAARMRRLLGEEKEKYDKERDLLKKDETLIENFFKNLKQKRQYYKEIAIEKIIEKIAKENELYIQKKSLDNQERMLTDKNQNVKAKYDALIHEIDNSINEYLLQCGQKKNDIEHHLTEKLSAIQTEYANKIQLLNEHYQQCIDDVQERYNDAQKEMNSLQINEHKITTFNPFATQMDSLLAQINEQNERKFELSTKVNDIQKAIDKYRSDAEIQRKDLENICNKDIIEINYEQQRIEQEIVVLDELLGRQKGSFIEWLSNNVKGWENNIGRVVGNEVLYNTSLAPSKMSDDDSLYGVTIETRNIDKTVDTPEEIMAKKTELERKLNDLKSKANERKLKLERDIKEMERTPQTKVKQLRSQLMENDVELRQIPSQIKRCNKELDEYRERLKDWRNNELASVRNKIATIKEQINELELSQNKLKLSKQKDVDNINKLFTKEKKDVEVIATQQKRDIDEALSKQREQAAVSKSELELQMDAELKGLGVDVNRLSQIRRELQRINDNLEFIEQHRGEYYRWKQDTEEYFDKESSKKEERKLVVKKLSELKDKYDERRRKKEEELQSMSDELQKLKVELSKLSDAIEKVRLFINNDTCPTQITKVRTKETTEMLSSILDYLKENIYKQQQRLEDFKKAVTAFKSNFSAQNTFHFRTEFNIESDYVDFASELNEFVSNAKIEEYRIRTSSQYADIIKRIAREVSDLQHHNADIVKTINEINRDFRENNFAGVIKEIELRAVESSDRLMQQLLNIKKFDDEHGFDIGQLNLFTNEDTLNRTNQKAVALLMDLVDMMDVERKRDKITLSDTFKLEFKVKENDNDTNWVEKLSNVGSDGTDILVKSMVNIMLINVFKQKISRHYGNFKLHCMMDEIGKLHPDNVEGILKFANVRNIFLINSSPTTYNAQVYKYTYSLSKDEKSNTVVKTLLTIR